MFAPTNFLSTNVTFYSKREGKTIKTTQIDVGRLNQEMSLALDASTPR